MKVVKVDVLDHGYVELIDMMGDDHRILQAARASTGGEGYKTDKADRGLIRYLYRNKHSSPFEKVVFEFKVKLPIFVARQWMRHRTQSYNEYSSRYSKMIDEFYSPETFRKQGEKNHQGSGENFRAKDNVAIKTRYNYFLAESYNLYDDFIEHEVAREQARMVVPVSQYTIFYTTINLWNLFHFLELRLHDHAQFEIREYAYAILEILKSIDSIKWSVEVFNDMRALDILFQDLKNQYSKNSDELAMKLINILEENKNDNTGH